MLKKVVFTIGFLASCLYAGVGYPNATYLRDTKTEIAMKETQAVARATPAPVTPIEPAIKA